MHKNVTLEVLDALMPLVQQHPDLVSVEDSEIFHVIFRDDAEYFFKILRTDRTTDHKQVYRAELNPSGTTELHKRHKVIYPENLAKEFENWISLISKRRNYIENLQKANTIDVKNEKKTDAKAEKKEKYETLTREVTTEIGLCKFFQVSIKWIQAKLKK